jgi:ankyrin repeat protein
MAAFTDQAVYLECRKNNIQFVKDLLLKNTQTDPEFSFDIAMSIAIRFGHEQIVKLLLDSKKINPIALKSLFVSACSLGRYNVVKLFLDFRKIFPFPPIDPNDEFSNFFTLEYEAMYASCLKGHADVVQLLIEEGGIDPSIDEDMPIRTAIKSDQNGNNENVIRLLLQYPNVNPSASSNEALDHIMREGNLYTLRYLLEIDDPRINPYLPSMNVDDYPNYHEIIQLLEHDARFFIPHNLARDKILEEYILSEKYVYSKKYDNVLLLLPHHAPVGGPFGTTLAWGWGHRIPRGGSIQSDGLIGAEAVGGPPTADLEYLARNKEKLALMGSYPILPDGHRLRHAGDRLSSVISLRDDILKFLKGKRTRRSSNRKKRTYSKKSKNK